VSINARHATLLWIVARGNLTAEITDYIAESTEEVFASMEQIP
jgi:hypothetical protein